MSYFTYNGEGKHTARQVAKLHHSETFESVDYRDEAKLLAVEPIARYVAPEVQPTAPTPLAERIEASKNERALAYSGQHIAWPGVGKCPDHLWIAGMRSNDLAKVAEADALYAAIKAAITDPTE